MPSVPAWASAFGPKAATHNGGCGCCKGSGERIIGGPSPSAATTGSPRQARTIVRTLASKMRRLSRRETEKASNIAGW